MKKLFKLVVAVAASVMLVSAAFGQTGKLQPGQVWGNGQSTAQQPTGTSLSAIMDQGLSCSARGSIVFRGTSAWACLAPGAAGTPLTSNGAGADLSYGTVALGAGGTGQTTARLARTSAGLNIDQLTTVGNADTTIAATTRVLATSVTLTAIRTFTLPAATAMNAGQVIVILDQFGAVNGSNVISIVAAGSDTINGVTSTSISSAYGGVIAWCDGVSKWTFLATGSGGGNVNGPAGAVANNFASFNGTTGTLLKDSGISSSNLPSVSAKDYASGSISTTTGTITAASATLTLASALDFKNGQGIRVNHAGTAHGVTIPTGANVVTVGTAGSTTYTYTIVAFNATGGYAAPIANFSIATGNATLSMTNYNSLSWAAGTGQVGYAIYGRISGSLALIGYTNGTTFFDYGPSSYYQVNAADWITSAVPAGAANNWLVTSVTSGGGTTTLVLATPAVTTATAQVVAHDDTAALQAALTAAKNAGKGLNLSGGGFRTTSAISTTGPIEVSGSTGGNLASSALILTSPTQDGIVITSGNYSNFHGFSVFGGGGTAASQMQGSGISWSAASQINTVRSVFMNLMWNALTVNTGPYYISENLLSGYGAGINAPAFGDSSIVGNDFNPLKIPGNNGGGGLGIDAGGNPAGIRVIGNKFNAPVCGYDYGIQLTVSVSDGDFLLSGNSMEGWCQNAVIISRVGSAIFGNIQIVGNQITGGQGNPNSRGIFMPQTAAFTTYMVVTGNIILATLDAINVQGVAGINIDGNMLTATNGISLGTAVTGCGIGFNSFQGTSNQISTAISCVYAQTTTTKPAYP